MLQVVMDLLKYQGKVEVVWLLSSQESAVLVTRLSHLRLPRKLRVRKVTIGK